MQFLSVGDTAISLQFGDRIDQRLNLDVLRCKAAVDRARLSGVVETVPSYRALTIHYDPIRTTREELISRIRPLLDHDLDVDLGGWSWRIPVCYDRDFAPDLDHVAGYAGMSADRVVGMHTSIQHYVYMIGFAPGQPHMGDLPSELTLPRRKSPRPVVERGSIVIAIGLSIIYPFANPSGWHIIGRTPIPVFDLAKDPPNLLRPGDVVRFTSITRRAFDELQAEIAAGHHELEPEA